MSKRKEEVEERRQEEDKRIQKLEVKREKVGIGGEDFKHKVGKGQ